MDITTPPQSAEQVSAGGQPAFHKRWDGWSVTWIFLLVLFLFYVIQVIATVAVVYTQFGTLIMELARTGNQAALTKFFQSPEGLARIFSAENLFLIQVVSAGSLVGMTLLFGRVFGAKPRDFGLGQPTPPSAVLFGVVGGILLFALSTVVELIQERIVGPHPQAIVQIFAHHRGTLSYVFDFASVSVTAPIAEELFFRGMLFTALVQRMPLAYAATISGILFGLGHVDPWNIVPLSVLGIGLAYIYYRTQTIWANVAAHATINAVSLSLAFLFPQLASR